MERVAQTKTVQVHAPDGSLARSGKGCHLSCLACAEASEHDDSSDGSSGSDDSSAASEASEGKDSEVQQQEAEFGAKRLQDLSEDDFEPEVEDVHKLNIDVEELVK